MNSEYLDMPHCPNCGNEVSEEASFCTSCGYALSASAVKPVPQVPGVPERVAHRPTGVTIIAVLEVLGGLVFFGLGAIMLVMVGMLGTGSQVQGFPVLGGILGVVLGVVGGVMVVIGIVSFVIAYGYWNGRGWAWTVGMVFAVLGIIIGLITLPGGIISIILDVIIVYYLTRPHVKTYFGKKPASFTI